MQAEGVVGPEENLYKVEYVGGRCAIGTVLIVSSIPRRIRSRFNSLAERI